MKQTVFAIEHIPAVVYGDESEQVYLFVHGRHGCKEEGADFAALACPKGWQVLGIDLPEHGVRKGEAERFDPWHAVPELRAVMAYIRPRWSRVALRASSLGAWFSMLAFVQEPLEQCLMVSPILDMEGLIRTMMGWSGVTEGELEERGTVSTSFGETLSWRYYQYAKDNPIQTWLWPTAVLYAEGDELTPRQTAEDFAARFGCGLTVMENGEHWFHTPEQLDFLDRWTQERIPSAVTPEECLFFAGRPEGLALYETFRFRLLTLLGEVRIKVQRTQITFAGKYGFAFVSLPRRKGGRGIVVSFGTFDRQDSPRIQYVSEPYPNRWTHHVSVRCMEEINQELMNWIQEAYWVSRQK